MNTMNTENDASKAKNRFGWFLSRPFERLLDLSVVIVAVACALGVADNGTKNIAYWFAAMAAINGSALLYVGDSDTFKDPSWYDATIRIIQVAVFTYAGWWWCSAAWTLSIVSFSCAKSRSKKKTSSTKE